MKPIKRIESLLEGKKLETPAINLWKHFPPYDENPQDLVRKTVQFQERFNWDFVKVTFQGLFSIQDWGSKIKCSPYGPRFNGRYHFGFKRGC